MRRDLGGVPVVHMIARVSLGQVYALIGDSEQVLEPWSAPRHARGVRVNEGTNFFFVTDSVPRT